MKITGKDVKEAADAFYDSLRDDFDEEYGISRDDSERGMIAALEALGLLSSNQAGGIRFGIKRARVRDERERLRVEEARRAALTPEQREREDKSRALTKQMFGLQSKAMESILNRAFESKPLFTFLKGKP